MLPPLSVYPRWRGEHTAIECPCVTTNGLSPLARGTPNPIKPINHTNRFIPAGAGNTSPIMSSIAETAVYPRWRGEHLRNSVSTSLINGLSPLARGTQQRMLYRPSYRGFIPAGAGNTVIA